MSVIVAVKENGVVYMAADTQTTAGKNKFYGLNETAFKVARLKNGMLVGFCGRVAARQTILSSCDDYFTLNEQGGLDKKHIVNRIVPKLENKMEEIGDKEYWRMDVSILLAYKDKLYKITDDLKVISVNEFIATGSGADYAFYVLSEMQDLSVRDRILKALTESANRTEAVGGPYALIDTENLEYEIVDMGEENY